MRSQLRALAQDLLPSLSHLVCASTFAVIAAALDSHVRDACRRGWILPRLAYGPDAAAAAAVPMSTVTSPAGLVVDGMWPYWLDSLDPKTVRNSFTMEVCLGSVAMRSGVPAFSRR